MEPIQPGDVISHIEMCLHEGTSLQRGMNFRLKGNLSLILMSVRKGAPYSDRIEEGGKVLIYEGHDHAKTRECPNPKKLDQPDKFSAGALTQNGLFWKAALEYKEGTSRPEQVKVYEKIKTGIRVYAGVFQLLDAWKEDQGDRKVFKFKLRVCDIAAKAKLGGERSLDHARIIPTQVKIDVWKRDKGRCVLCNETRNLHFDHILPFSKGGTSLLSSNVQLLCAKHNLQKRDKIE